MIFLICHGVCFKNSPLSERRPPVGLRESEGTEDSSWRTFPVRRKIKEAPSLPNLF